MYITSQFTTKYISRKEGNYTKASGNISCFSKNAKSSCTRHNDQCSSAIIMNQNKVKLFNLHINQPAVMLAHLFHPLQMPAYF